MVKLYRSPLLLEAPNVSDSAFIDDIGEFERQDAAANEVAASSQVELMRRDQSPVIGAKYPLDLNHPERNITPCRGFHMRKATDVKCYAAHGYRKHP